MVKISPDETAPVPMTVDVSVMTTPETVVLDDEVRVRVEVVPLPFPLPPPAPKVSVQTGRSERPAEAIETRPVGIELLLFMKVPVKEVELSPALWEEAFTAP